MYHVVPPACCSTVDWLFRLADARQNSKPWNCTSRSLSCADERLQVSMTHARVVRLRLQEQDASECCSSQGAPSNAKVCG
jgi:hypothetical protein